MEQPSQQNVPSLAGQANQVVELNVTGGALGLNKMSKREEAPYAAEDAQVVGLVFHQSKEVLIMDHGAGSNGDVSMASFFRVSGRPHIFIFSVQILRKLCLLAFKLGGRGDRQFKYFG